MDNLLPGRGGARVEPEVFENPPDHFDVVSRLQEVLVKRLQVDVDDALEGGLGDLDPPSSVSSACRSSSVICSSFISACPFAEMWQLTPVR